MKKEISVTVKITEHRLMALGPLMGELKVKAALLEALGERAGADRIACLLQRGILLEIIKAGSDGLGITKGDEEWPGMDELLEEMAEVEAALIKREAQLDAAKEN